MAIHVTQFGEHSVNLSLWTGAIAPEDVLAHYRSLNAGHAVNAHWISYFHPNADLSALDFSAFPEIKRALTAKLEELYGDKPFVTAMVCDSNINQSILSMWRSYAGSDFERARPGLFTSLKGACDWMGLPDAARAALAAEVSGSRASASSRPMSMAG